MICVLNNTFKQCVFSKKIKIIFYFFTKLRIINQLENFTK